MKKIIVVILASLWVSPHLLAGEAKLFAEGVVSTELPEFALSFSPDRETLYFNRMSADRQEMGLYRADLLNGEWANVRLVSFADDHYRDVDPFVTADGARMYFSSNRPRPDGTTAPDDYDIWYVDRKGAGWGNPVHGGMVINSDESEIYTSVTREGVIYYTRFLNDYKDALILRTRWMNGGFQEPEAIPFQDLAGMRLTNPTIAPDEDYILLVGGDDQGDLYMSRQSEDGTWSKPHRLGDEVNSDFTEFAPAIASDGYLYFTSERPGVVGDGWSEGRRPGDIYRIALPAHWDHKERE